jgi:hypothetical protein
MKYFDMRGSNQYKSNVHRFMGLKDSQLKDIARVTFPLIIMSVMGMQIQSMRPATFVSPIPMDSYVVYADEYKQPEESPAPEREAMIKVIKQIWRRDWKVGVAIASCESGLDHTQKNVHNTDHSIDYGLFEINSIHGMNPDDMMNAVANAGYAYSLYKEQGLNPWSSSSKCWKERL